MTCTSNAYIHSTLCSTACEWFTPSRMYLLATYQYAVATPAPTPRKSTSTDLTTAYAA